MDGDGNERIKCVNEKVKMKKGRRIWGCMIFLDVHFLLIKVKYVE